MIEIATTDRNSSRQLRRRFSRRQPLAAREAIASNAAAAATPVSCRHASQRQASIGYSRQAAIYCQLAVELNSCNRNTSPTDYAATQPSEVRRH